jgi:hypothetical protein
MCRPGAVSRDARVSPDQLIPGRLGDELGAVVARAVDGRGHGPGDQELGGRWHQELGDGFGVVVRRVQPGVPRRGRQDDRHPVVDRRHCLVGRRGDDRGGAQRFALAVGAPATPPTARRARWGRRRGARGSRAACANIRCFRGGRGQVRTVRPLAAQPEVRPQPWPARRQPGKSPAAMRSLRSSSVTRSRSSIVRPSTPKRMELTASVAFSTTW